MSTDQHKRGEQNTENNDVIANRHPHKTINDTGDAQNVRDENVAPLERLSDNELEHARNKAMEGQRRNDDTGRNNSSAGA